MKPQVALLSIFLFTTGLAAQDRPDGLLGTNTVSFGASYTKANANYAKGDREYEGYRLSTNRNLYASNDFGIDAGLEYSYSRNHDWRNVYHLTEQDYAAYATIYRNGMISPFLTVGVSIDDARLSSKRYPLINQSETNTLIEGAIGVECHLAPGWWVTPAIYRVSKLDSDNDTNSYTQYELGTGYWFNAHFGVSADMFYSTISHVDYSGAEVTISYKY